MGNLSGPLGEYHPCYRCGKVLCYHTTEKWICRHYPFVLSFNPRFVVRNKFKSLEAMGLKISLKEDQDGKENEKVVGA
jgi:hypothetical protein